MSIVTLVSGGLDSSLVAQLISEAGHQQFPLFVNYGQRACDKEYDSCCRVLASLKLPEPSVARLDGFGALIRSGLTDTKLDVVDNAFTPGRNALFLLVAASYAMQVNADAVAIGLLDERYRLFPDQSKVFVEATEEFLFRAMGKQISLLAPLMTMSKSDVVKLAEQRNIRGTYSCHFGADQPCGKCIACREFEGTEA